MSTPFMGELKLISWNFAPQGWAFCNGQFLPINQNQALFALLGTTYGGNGQTTFALPDLRGKIPLHFGNGITQGEAAGQEAHTVTIQEMPQHLHFLQGVTDNASGDTPDSTTSPNFMLATAALDLYKTPTNLVSMDPTLVGNVGGSQAHNNNQPFLVMNWIIALQGIFPSQN
jgi:microcystin-dependent protein